VFLQSGLDKPPPAKLTGRSRAMSEPRLGVIAFNEKA
jgi:hypothetical protein